MILHDLFLTNREDQMTGKKFWDIVKLALKKNGQTQLEAAAACGIKPRTLQYWMYRDLYPTIIDGYLLARFLGVSVDYLVTGKKKNDRNLVNSARSHLKEADHNLKKITL